MSRLVHYFLPHVLIVDFFRYDTVRTKRVKEARDEAKKEISDYKNKKEEEYKKFEAEVRV